MQAKKLVKYTTLFIGIFTLLVVVYELIPHPLHNDFYNKVHHFNASKCTEWKCLTVMSYHVLFTYYLFHIQSLFHMDPLGATVKAALACLALLLCLLFYFTERVKLPRAQRALLVAFFVLGGPGVFQLIWQLEDNIYYYPFTVLFLSMLVLSNRAYSKLDGKFALFICFSLALATLINFTNLIFVYYLAAMSILAFFVKKPMSKKLAMLTCGYLATCLCIYLIFFSKHPGGNPVATFVMKSASLDLGMAKWSVERFSLAHLKIYGEMLLKLFGGVSVFSFIGVLGVFACVGFVIKSEACRLKKISLMMLAATVLFFPLVYETEIIERWDMLWFFCSLCVVRLAVISNTASATKKFVWAVVLFQLLNGVYSSANQLIGQRNHRGQFGQLNTLIEQIPNKQQYNRAYIPVEYCVFDGFIKASFKRALKHIYYVERRREKYITYKSTNYDRYLDGPEKLADQVYNVSDSLPEFKRNQAYIHPSLNLENKLVHLE